MTLLTLLPAALAQAPAYAPASPLDAPVTGGELRVAGATSLPMVSQRFEVELHSGVAAVHITQVFENPFDETVAGLYALALPLGSAATEVTLYADDRVIDARIGTLPPRPEGTPWVRPPGASVALAVDGVCPGSVLVAEVEALVPAGWSGEEWTLSLPIEAPVEPVAPWQSPAPPVTEVAVRHPGVSDWTTLTPEPDAPLTLRWPSVPLAWLSDEGVLALELPGDAVVRGVSFPGLEAVASSWRGGDGVPWRMIAEVNGAPSGPGEAVVVRDGVRERLSIDVVEVDSPAIPALWASRQMHALDDPDARRRIALAYGLPEEGLGLVQVASAPCPCDDEPPRFASAGWGLGGMGASEGASCIEPYQQLVAGRLEWFGCGPGLWGNGMGGGGVMGGFGAPGQREELPPAALAEGPSIGIGGVVQRAPAVQRTPALATLAPNASAEGATGPGLLGGEDPFGDRAEDLDARQLRALIDQRIKRDLNSVEACYRRALRLEPTLEGEVVVQFALAPGGDGLPDDLSLSRSTLRAPSVEACVLDQLRWMKFPTPLEAPVVVRYPFSFRPEDA
ncbi:MAG: AgmX/PglI C-terminal domain-containing protein [Alphaproteobacteria bacterium]|nr:AgmX/PglI C-terminal domain-containing protein [Alphaproteobacteria bacterium]